VHTETERLAATIARLQERLQACRSYAAATAAAVRAAEERKDVYSPLCFETADNDYRVSVRLEGPSREQIREVEAITENTTLAERHESLGIPRAVSVLREAIAIAGNKFFTKNERVFLEFYHSRQGHRVWIFLWPADVPQEQCDTIQRDWETLGDALHSLS